MQTTSHQTTNAPIKGNETETATHVFWTYFYPATGLYVARFQPKNKKTGKPWQAVRDIIKGSNVIVFSNWKTEEKKVRSGSEIPENWTELDGGKWNSVGLYYATQSDALIAISNMKDA